VHDFREEIEEMKCELCLVTENLSQLGSFQYCPEHYERMSKRTGLATKENNQTIIEIDKEPISISLNERELRFYRYHKIFSNSAFVYFALRIEASEKSKSSGIDIQSFCNRWGVTQYDLTSAVSTLGKRGFVSLSGGTLSVEARCESDIINGLKRQVDHV
jgi:hypothetical protein